ncbi:MAG: VOC family protein [Holosporaceae bacterium]
MLHHASFAVEDFEKNLHFYDTTLALLGMERLMLFETPEHNVAGYGTKGKPCFWIGEDTKPNKKEFVGKARGFHLAFVANDTEAVQVWHKKCLELGATDNGGPGPRPHYHPNYYGAFVIDLNGWRIEAATPL